MSTFWQTLLAASSLPTGTTWELITHPKTGGSITYGSVLVLEDRSTVVYNATTPKVTNIVLGNPKYPSKY